jgi:hypothetical protein
MLYLSFRYLKQYQCVKCFKKSFFDFCILSFLHLLICVYIVWATPLPLCGQNLFCSLVLWFCWRDNKKDSVFLPVWDKDSYKVLEISSVASMHMYVTTWIGSSLPDLFTISQLPSHSGLCQFKSAVFVSIQWTHQPHSSFEFLSLSLFLQCMFSP